MGSVVAGFCVKCGAVASVVGGATKETVMCNSCENFYKKQTRAAVLKEQEEVLRDAIDSEQRARQDFVPQASPLSWADVANDVSAPVDETSPPNTQTDSKIDYSRLYDRLFSRGCTEIPTLQMLPKKIYEITMGLDVEHGETLTINGTRYLLSEEVLEWLRAAVK